MESFKVDLHCHCYYSRVTDNKLMSAFCVNESYDSPDAVYKMAKSRGMDAVTITDHNVITGGLKLKEKYDDAFVSEEICAFFPEDNFRMHVLALDIDEKIHDEISRLRFNVYDLVQYFKQEDILYVLAHPAWGPSEPPKREHFEKFLVLFDKWEFFNGSRSMKNHDFVKALAASYRLEQGVELARKHQLPAPTHTQIVGTGGSDSHVVRHIATAHTEVQGAKNYKEFLQGIRTGNVTYTGKMQTTLPFAQTVYDLLGKHYTYGQPFIVRKIKDRSTKALARMYFGPLKKFCKGKQNLKYQPEQLLKDLDKRFEKTFTHMLRKLASRRGIDLMKDGVYPLADLALLFTPFMSSANYKYNFDKQLPKGDDFFPSINEDKPTKVAVVGDNMLSNHGVTFRVQHMLSHSQGKSHEIVPVTCSLGDSGKYHLIRPLRQFPIPDHPSEKLSIPSFSEILLMLESEDIELVHITTPGTLGFFAMLAAKLLGLPVVGSYHTDVTEYISHYNANPIFRQLFGKAQTFFYNQCDLVLALSEHSRHFLIDSGIAAEKIQVMKTGVDQKRFNPTVSGTSLRQQLNPENKFLILFAGRIEREKNIDLLLASFDKIYQANNNVMLAIAGNGNLRAEVERSVNSRYPAGTVKFLDWVSHKEMPNVYAAADLFLFPSDTETFGNVILEAQSCALPTLVSSEGAAAEIVEHARTGFVCNANDPNSYARAALLLMRDAALHKQMRINAAELGRRYNWGHAVDHLFGEYARFTNGREAPGIESLA